MCVCIHTQTHTHTHTHTHTNIDTMKGIILKEIIDFSFSTVLNARTRQWCLPALHLSANTERVMEET